jgi:hypothetical protein
MANSPGQRLGPLQVLFSIPICRIVGYELCDAPSGRSHGYTRTEEHGART